MVRRPQESGYALIFALLVIVLTMAAGALIATSLQLRMRLVRQQATELQVTALCDAALALALAELDLRSSYPGTDGFVPFDDGEIQIRVETTAYHRVTVDVEGAFSGRRRAARADVRLEPTHLISWQPVAPSDEDVPWWR